MIFFTFTVLCFRVKGVSGSARLRPNASVASDGVVAALRLQTFVVVDLALVNVFASVSERIKCKADLAITSKATGHVCANLIRVTGFPIRAAFIDV